MPSFNQVLSRDFATRDQSEMISDACQRRRWESNPKRRDTLTRCRHSVFRRIAVAGMQPDLLLTYPEVPWNPATCPTLCSLCGH